MDWKNFEKDKKYFRTVLKIWPKNTCERAAFLETLQAAIILQRFPCILRKLILQEKFCRHIQKYAFFLLYNRLEAVSERRSESAFIVNLYSFSLLPVPEASPSFPKVRHLPPYRQNNFETHPSLDTSTVA